MGNRGNGEGKEGEGGEEGEEEITTKSPPSSPFPISLISVSTHTPVASPIPSRILPGVDLSRPGRA
jgi:hypothetical protein